MKNDKDVIQIVLGVFTQSEAQNKLMMNMEQKAWRDKRDQAMFDDDQDLVDKLDQEMEGTYHD